MHLFTVASRLLQIAPSSSQAPRVQQFGALALNLVLQQASIDGEPIPFSPAEFAVVRLLASRPNIAMTKQAILAELGSDVIQLDPRLVDVSISRARRKLEAAGAGGLIQTLAGRGYAMVRPDDRCGALPTMQDGLDPVPIAA